MVQYYTLEQAAQILRTTPEKLREMAKRNEVRAFQDRGSLRFRAQEIDELARSLGLGSDADIAVPPASGTKLAGGGPKTTKHVSDSGALKLGLEDSDEVPLGQDSGPDRGGPRSSIGSRKPPSSRSPTPKSPPPKPASDSDVRLVMEGGDLDFTIGVDSGVKIARDPGQSSRTRPGEPGKPPSSKRMAPPDKPDDSDVKIAPEATEEVPLGEMRTKAPSDSDIRLEEDRPALPTGGRKMEHVTEEIDLDAEQAAVKPRSPAPRPRPSSASHPAASPFELSGHEIPVKGPATKPPSAKTDETDSSDFELALDDSSPVDLGSSDEVPVQGGSSSDEEVTLGELGGASGASGINLQEPVDSGISLEQGGSDEIEFELSLDPGAPSSHPRTQAPSAKQAKQQEESSSSSEFELSLDQGDSSPAEATSSSEFELNLDVEGSSDLGLEPVQSDSDSEFELTLDESGTLAPSDDEEHRELLETEFEVPAGDDSDDAAALEEEDTDLESSDFDLQLEDSGSEAVALDEAEAESAEAAEEGGFEEDLEGEPEEEYEEPVAAGAVAPPAPWGVLPVVLLVPSVLILFVVGLMSFELMQSMWGYHRPGKVSTLVIDPIARMFDDTLPKD
jgi:excisionase family DNA binding protein